MPTGPALQEFFSAFRVFVFRVGLVINKLPRASRFRGQRRAAHMLRQAPPQVRRVPNVKPVVLRGMQQVHVKHPLYFLSPQPREAKPFTRSPPYLSIFTGNRTVRSLRKINCCLHLNVMPGFLGSQPFGFGNTATSMADCSRVRPRALTPK
jgi:hypothetical protein